MKQTAVEWLVKEFNLESHKATIALVQEMEKQQIINAYDVPWQSDVINGEDYYNKTFKKQ